MMMSLVSLELKRADSQRDRRPIEDCAARFIYLNACRKKDGYDDLLLMNGDFLTSTFVSNQIVTAIGYDRSRTLK